MVELPPGYRVVGQAGAKPIVQKKPRKKSGYKTPLAVRKAAKKAREQIKLPFVKGAVIAGPVVDAGVQALDYAEPKSKLKAFLRNLKYNYTGIFDDMGGNFVRWDWQRPAATWGSLFLLVADAKYFGALKYANQQLARANVPIARL